MDLQELGIASQNTKADDAIRAKKADAARRQREYREKNRDRILAIERRSKALNKDLAKEAAYAKEWRAKNPERHAASRKAWVEKNRDSIRQKTNSYYALKKDRRRAQAKEYRNRNAEVLKERRQKNYAEKKGEINARSNQWWKDHPEKAREKHIKYLPRRLELRKLRRASDPVERIKDSCRTRTRFILSQAGVQKHDHTFALVGCTPNFFKSFLEAQFKPEMNWDNYGTYWEIDHVVALKKFNLRDEGQRRAAFRYSNCRPLRKPENRSKCDRSIGPHQPLLL